MSNTTAGLCSVIQCIEDAAIKAQRDINDVKLIAVSKTFPVEVIYDAWQAGQKRFGENRLQDAITKIRTLKEILKSKYGQIEKSELPEWHFIGRIQSNKTKQIAENFSWVHSVDSIRLAEKISNARPKTMPPINVCLQLNLEEEVSKGGISKEEIVSISREIIKLPGIQYRGLMAIPKYEEDPEAMRSKFRAMREILHCLQSRHSFKIDTLSMGMSGDYKVAIEEGATMVRIGTAIFGERKSVFQ